MRNFRLAFALLAILVLLTSPAWGQATMSSTTLSSAITRSETYLNVASATGISGLGTNNQVQTILYVDQEAMEVIEVSGTTVRVLRGRGGTRATAHASGAKVWLGPPNYFLPTDPSGACTSTEQPVLPRVAISTGNVWNCAGGQWLRYGGSVFISPANCQMTAATTAWGTNGSPALVRAAASNLVLQGTTNTTAGTITVTCRIDPPTVLSQGKGVVVTDVNLLYGVGTTNLESIEAASLKTVTYPDAGDAADATVSSALGGTITVTPSTLETDAITTRGDLYNEKLSLGTPIALNTANQGLVLEQVFTTAGTTATILEIGGVIVHYSYAP